MQEGPGVSIFENTNITGIQGTSSAETHSQHPMDPFHRNYTLTGLVSHIQSTLDDIIQNKKAPKSNQQLNPMLELDKLLKMQQEISVLKNIIVFNLNEIFNNLYPNPPHLKPEPKTNDRNTLNTEDQPDESLAIIGLELENGEKYGKINHFEAKNDRGCYYQSKESKATEDPETKSQALSTSNPYKQIQRNRELTNITPFLLQDTNNNIRVQDQEFGTEEGVGDGFDLLCYEDEKSIEGYRGIRAKEAQEKGFSPIAQRAAEQQETAEKGMLSKDNITFNNFRSGMIPSSSYHGKGVDITRRLFSYTSVVLPKRLSRRKFNYLQQISQHRR